MVVTTRFAPISREINLILREDLSPATQSAALAQYAGEQLIEAQTINKAALGKAPAYQSFVDGARSNDLGRVRPNGVIAFEFDLFSGVFGYIDLLLIAFSPVRSGRYRRSHVLFADGVEIDQDGPLPDAKEFVYLNTQPYARKIERGLSKQAPDGVYHVVQTMASRRYGNVAKIAFSYRAIAGGSRERVDRAPAIIITP